MVRIVDFSSPFLYVIIKMQTIWYLLVDKITLMTADDIIVTLLSVKRLCNLFYIRAYGTFCDNFCFELTI